MNNVIREEFVALLHKGKVKFSFKKNDGTTRHALGTLHSSILPPMPTDPVLLAEAEKKSADAARANPLKVNFWDMDVKGFRSVNLDTMLTEPELVEEFT